MTSRNGDRKIMQSIRITSRPPFKNKEVEPGKPVQMKIYQSNTDRKDLNYILTMSQGFKRGSKGRINSPVYPFL